MTCTNTHHARKKNSFDGTLDGSDLLRGRRYKAVPDTTFIRFGRSGPASPLISRSSPAMQTDVDESEPRPLDQNPLFQSNSPYFAPYGAGEAGGGGADSPDASPVVDGSGSSTNGMMMMPMMAGRVPLMSPLSPPMMMEKKARPERYYLRFG